MRPAPDDTPRPPHRRAVLRHAVLATAGGLLSAGGLVACAPVAALNGLAALQGRLWQRDLPFGPDAHQRCDLYRPAGAPPPAGWPLVVFFYGGSWSSGRRADYRFVGEALASHGVLALVADYRLYPQVRYPAFLQDAAAALALGIAQAKTWGGHAQRVFVMGHSAGAYNAAMLALDGRWLAAHQLSPDRLAGWIGVAGPYDFLPIRTPVVQAVFGHPNVAADTQPVAHVAGSAVPALLLAAAQDTLVDPQRNTVALARALRAQGTPVQARLLDGVDHATVLGALAWPLQGRAPVLSSVLAFVAHPTGSA
ncbi:MAG: esterase [Burkholderiales bacterium PBB5]|nr:MAG: esterase [Burkholderiales bacterium PBB5]